MTAGTGDAAAVVEVKPKGHAETVHMDEPAAKIDTANGDLSAPTPLNEPAQLTKGTTHAENGVTQPPAESKVAAAATPVTESIAAGQPAPLPSPAGRLSSDDGSSTPAAVPTPPLTAPVLAAEPAAPPAAAVSPATAAAVSVTTAAATSQPFLALSPAAMTASQPAPSPAAMTASQSAPAPAAVSSPPALVSTPPALVSRPAVAPVPPAPPSVPLPTVSPASAAVVASSMGRKRSAEALVNSAEPAARQPRHSSSERQQDAPVPHRTVEMIESSLHKLKREVKAIDLLARQKEREWDNLLRLRRAKEETFQRLRRKREVLLQQPATESAMAAAIQPPAAPAAPAAPAPAPRPASAALTVAASTYSVSSAMWALKQQQAHQHQQERLQQHQHQQEQQRLQQQQQRLAQQQVLSQCTPRASAGLSSRPLRPVPVPPPPPFVGAAVSSAARLSQPARAIVASESHEPHYREILAQVAQVARLNQRLTGPADQPAADAAASAAAAAATHPSNLAKLLMEKKKIEPALLEMLKPQMTVRSSANGPLQLRTVAPVPAAPRPPPPPPPPASAADVPLCQGCGRRQAQFVCAGCGHQWYCSRDCQVEAWDSHADDCSG